MKKIIFKGIASALITPMRDGKIDYTSLEKIIERQINAGIDALVIGGTTGEAATLSDNERYELYSASKELVGGKLPLIFGTGTNDTRVALKHTEEAEKIGCDGVLAVTPYYNKGTRRGLIEHYKKIADSTSLPIILYNVPQRTGVDIHAADLGELSDKLNIVAIKEASDSLDKLVAISAMSEKIGLYAGSDSHTFASLAIGGLGVISVASNLFPELFAKLYQNFSLGDYAGARRIQNALLPFISAIFSETNPTPIKYAMSLAGLCSPEVRLPLYEAEISTRDRVKREYEKLSAFESE